MFLFSTWTIAEFDVEMDMSNMHLNSSQCILNFSPQPLPWVVSADHERTEPQGHEFVAYFQSLQSLKFSATLVFCWHTGLQQRFEPTVS
jgi:hypothetical protein